MNGRRVEKRTERFVLKEVNIHTTIGTGALSTVALAARRPYDNRYKEHL